MTTAGSAVRCCPKFDPGPWDGRDLEWKDKLFMKARILSVLHVPLNIRAVVERTLAQAEAARAVNVDNMMLFDENSMWGADLFVAVDKEVPGAAMARLSGRFMARVFEGPYRDCRKWMKEMNLLLRRRDKTPQRMLVWYTTCPECAKQYGKNYAVVFAQT